MKVEINPNQPDIFMEIDEEDYDLWMKYTWCFDGRYVKRKINGKRNGPNKPRDPAKCFYFHREVMNAKEGDHVDHIDRDKLNNKKSNLRICTQDQNNKNILGAGCYQLKNGRWQAKICHNYKNIALGRYDTYEEAHAAYIKKANELRGEFSAAKDM